MLECVPNVSEGRDREALAAFRRALEGTPGVRLLDATADSHHDRSVFTVVGEADPLVRALLALAREAVDRIDLRRHRGVHPRFGALDVAPFVPLDEEPFDEAVATARRLGTRLADELSLPVYLYEEAATRPERRNLADVRRGGFERLAERMRDPEWTPDFGPRAPHPTAGAVAVGARFFLVAVNVEVIDTELDTVRAVAREVRESSGGLPGVKALGIEMPGRGFQVSMNLVDYRQTPLSTLLVRVRRELEERGARFVRHELIGLLPRAAVDDELPDLLGWRPGEPRPVLEERMGDG